MAQFVNQFASVLPQFSATMELPQMLDPSAGGKSRVNRIHSKAVKTAMRETLIDHHRKRMRGHFRQTNRNKYRHYERTTVTKRTKRRRYHSITDLVASGRTRDKMVRAYDRLRVGGSAEGGAVTGTMSFKFPFPVARSVSLRKIGSVTPQKMTEEISRWTAGEEKEAAEFFIRMYRAEVLKALKPRMRKRLDARLASLGF